MAKQVTYTLQIDAEIKNLISKIDMAKKSMQSMVDSGTAPNVGKMFASMERALDNLQKRASMPITSEAAFSSLRRDLAEAELQVGKLTATIQDFYSRTDADKISLLPPNLQQQINSAIGAIDKFSQAYSKAQQETAALREEEEKLAEAQKRLQKATSDKADAEQLLKLQEKQVQTAQEEAQATKKKIEALKEYQKTLAAYEKAAASGQKVDRRSKATIDGQEYNLPQARANAKKTGADVSSSEAIAASIQNLTAQYQTQSKAVTDATNVQRGYEKTLQKTSNEVTLASQKVQTLSNSAATLRQQWEAQKLQDVNQAFANLRNEAAALGIDLTNIPLDYTDQGFQDLTQALINLKQQGIAQADAALASMEQEVGEIGQAVRETSQEVNESNEAFRRLDSTMSDISSITNRIKQFVGLQGAVTVARRALQSAFKTIQDLDAAMTEMAVVTDLEIGDYWRMLPTFTANANALGVSIQSAYEATTLYLQQGLKMAKAQEISNETLKMARIAGLDAAEATNKMTAALRGFNMELNETSAQRVSDVYSQLAAITAADVNEISSAMTKTASIAASAGMEFETTAAFLSQIIETTRESAETAGTALKTVIARFQELKKDPSEIGEVDGEIVDANKIETALRSVGVSLRDSQGQFRELDEVFLELSGKWDSLDTNTQRYIATIAAGSRQQSRFIAMMSDYSRTQELVTAANNSAGASNAQFEKTLDSLKSKLERLQNSWNTFTMHLLDNEAIKVIVDLLNGLITAINGFIDAADKIGMGWVASMGIVVGALTLGSKALKTFEMHLLAVDATGKRLYGTFGAIGATGVSAFTAIKTAITGIPISLKAIHAQLVGFSKNSGLANAIAQSKQYQDATWKVQQSLGKTQKAEAALQKAVTEKVAANKKVIQAEQTLAAVKKKTGATQQEQTDAENALIKAKEEYSKSAKKSRAIEQQVSRQKKQLATDEASLLAVVGLNTKQKDAYDAMVAKGIPIEEAAILAKKGMTVADIEAYAAKKSLTFEQAKEELLRKRSIKEIIADIAVRMLSVGALKAEEKGKQAGALASLTKAWADKIAAGSTWALAGAIGAAVAILLVFIAMIALAVMAIKEYIDNSPEKKIEKANKAVEQATQVADEAAQAYNDLADAVDSLNDKWEALDDLVVGTKDWKDAVHDINQEVLDLIDLYPQLADAFEMNAEGVFVLKSNQEGALDDLLLQQQEIVNQTKAAEVGAKLALGEAVQNKQYASLSNRSNVGNLDEGILAASIGGGVAGAAGGAAIGYGAGQVGRGILGTAAASTAVAAPVAAVLGALAVAAPWIGMGIGGLAGGIGAGFHTYNELKESTNQTKENRQYYTEEIAKAVAEGKLSKDASASEISKFMQEELKINKAAADMWAKPLSDSMEELYEYGKDTLEAEKLRSQQAKVLGAQTLQAIDMSKYSAQEQSIMKNLGMSSEFIDRQIAQAEEQIADELEGMSKKEMKAWMESEAMALFGTSEVTADNKGNVTVGSGDNARTYSKEEFLTQLATADAQKDMSNTLKELPQQLKKTTEKMSGSMASSFLKVFEKEEGKKLTQEDIDTLKNLSDDELRKIYQDSPALQEIYGTMDEFVVEFDKMLQMGIDRIEIAKKDLASMGANTRGLGEGMSSEQLGTYYGKLKTVYGHSGQEGIDQIDALLEGLTKNMSEETKSSFLGQLFASDWGNIDDLKQLPFVLENMGIDVPTNELTSFIDVLIDLGGAVQNLTDAFLNSLRSTVAEIKEIRSGNKNTISAELKQEMIKYGGAKETEFVASLNDPEQFYYIGSDLQGTLDKTSREKSGENAVENSTTKKTLDFLKKDYSTEIVSDSIKLTYGDSKGYRDTFEDRAMADYYNYAKKNGLSLDYYWKVARGEMDFRNQVGGRTFKGGNEFYDFVTTQNYGSIDNYSTRSYSLDEIIQADSNKNVFFKKEWLANFYRQMLSNGVDISSAHSLFQDEPAQVIKKIEAADYNTIEEALQALKSFQGEAQMDYEKEIMAQIEQWTIMYQGYDLAAVSNALAKREDMTDEQQYGAQRAFSQMALEAGADTELLDQYYTETEILKSLKEGTEEYNEQLTKVSILENKIVASTGLVSRWENLENALSEFTDGLKRYSKAATEFEKSQIAKTLGKKFKIDIDDSNINSFMRNLELLLDPGTAEQGLNKIFRMYGVRVGRALSSGLEISSETADYDQIKAIGDEYVKMGLGVWETLENGHIRFVKASGDALAIAVEEMVDRYESAWDKTGRLQRAAENSERRRELHERDYQAKIKDKDILGASNVRNLTDTEIISEKALQEQIRKDSVAENNKIYYSLSDEERSYVEWDSVSGEFNTTAAYDNLSPEDKEFFENKFINEMAENSDKTTSAIDAIYDLEDEEFERREKEDETLSDMLTRTKDALIAEQQKQIDDLSSIYDAIKEAQDKLVSKIQEQINETRQARENEKTEQELANKELRLAYLQMNSAGNENEILSLQKEIEEGQQSYQDTLVDQSIQNLQDANEKAAEQRERQIEILESQLDLMESSPDIWEKAGELLQKASEHVQSGGDIKDTEWYKLMYKTEIEEENKNPIEFETWTTELTNSIAIIIGNLQNLFKNYNIEWSDASKFKTGGLADYTGPAWLDGTPSKPELVLNARDTANFIQLKDILSDILTGASTIGKDADKQGDNYFDIEISVDSLGDDYDVEQLADKIRSMIYEDSVYRNVNMINNLR